MVELVEVEDESFETKQVGPSDDEDYTDTGMHINLTAHTSSPTNITLPRVGDLHR
jgi:import receptor subunit TOM22